METTDLGKWMITNGGEYNPDTTYEQLTMILYQNSTYITLRTVTGIIPNNDKINYILMAQGFSANALADVVAKDTYGAIGNVGESVSAQSLVDYLTNEVVNNLIKKTSISTVQVNSDDMVPSSSLSYSMQRAIDNINSNLISKGIVDPQSAQANINTDWVSSGSVYYRITNGICFVDFDLTLKTITILNTLIVSGLPTAKIMAHSKLQGWEDNTISVPCYVFENNMLANPGPAGHYVGSFSYAVR